MLLDIKIGSVVKSSFAYINEFYIIKFNFIF